MSAFKRIYLIRHWPADDIGPADRWHLSNRGHWLKTARSIRRLARTGHALLGEMDGIALLKIKLAPAAIGGQQA